MYYLMQSQTDMMRSPVRKWSLLLSDYLSLLTLSYLIMSDLVRTSIAQESSQSSMNVNKFTYYHQTGHSVLHGKTYVHTNFGLSNHDAVKHKPHPENFPKYHIHQTNHMAPGFKHAIEVGQFCEAKQCCPGRDDTCTVPILDTVCYCDMFCNRTVADCCPDFWGYCMGIDAPDGAMTHNPHMPTPDPNTIKNNCHHQGHFYNVGELVHVNCNNCTCVKVDFTTEYNWKCTQKICLIRPELMEHVNTGVSYGWKGTNYTNFWGKTLEIGVALRLGTKRPMDPVKQMTSLRVHVNDILPTEFDARLEWPGKIHPIMDQGDCGASWAFSTTSVAGDRLAIHSSGLLYDALSPQHLLSCNHDHLQGGCQGGHLDRAWWYLRRVGVVSEGCYPYRSGVSGERGKCHIPRYKTLVHRVKCPSSKQESSLVYQASPPYRIAPSEREIMKEVMENGPVQATMEVKEDFFMYRAGVYRYSLPANYLPPNHRTTGFHSIKILGWGVDYTEGRPLKYWLCANSWGPKWGEDGYFRILRGIDECKIESFVVGIWGKVNGRPVIKRKRGPKRRAAESVHAHT